MATKGLEARIAALETALGGSTEHRGGVLVLLPGEAVDTALARVGPGNWLIVPGVFKSSEAWSRHMLSGSGSGELRGVCEADYQPDG